MTFPHKPKITLQKKIYILEYSRLAASVRMADEGVHKLIRVRVVCTPISAQTHIVHIFTRQYEIDARVIDTIAKVSRFNGLCDNVDVAGIALEGITMRLEVIHGGGEFERAGDRVVVAVRIKTDYHPPGPINEICRWRHEMIEP